ncbi:MAG: GGDEF domain-containing protein [Candidatus Nanopelagicales bacterium]|nr:GGDEF domain-containing protein [Candidatus Nanopelagicales bacterium]
MDLMEPDLTGADLEVAPLATFEQQDSADLAAERGDLSTMSALPLLMGALGLLLVLSSLVSPQPDSSFMGFVGVGLGVVCGMIVLVAAIVLSRRNVRVERAHAVAAGAILGSAVSLVFSMAATGSLAPTMYLQLLVVVAGAVLRRPGWVVGVQVGLWTMWLAVIAWVPNLADLGSWLIAMLAATLIAVAINVMRARALLALAGALAQAEAEAVHDVLTGLFNRRGLLVVGDEMLALGRRTREPVCCTFIDVDGLKDVNDRLGHDKGDNVLLAVADSLRLMFRESDVLARWGGDEFVVLGLGTGPDVADMEKRLILSLADNKLAGSGLWHPFVSAGRVVHMPWHDETLDQLLERADQDMYGRRRSRRANQVGDPVL